MERKKKYQDNLKIVIRMLNLYKNITKKIIDSLKNINKLIV